MGKRAIAAIRKHKHDQPGALFVGLCEISQVTRRGWLAVSPGGLQSELPPHSAGGTGVEEGGNSVGIQSPCDQWTAPDIVVHVVERDRSVISGARGGEPKPFGSHEDPRRAWDEISQAAAITRGSTVQVVCQRGHRSVRDHGHAPPHMGPGTNGRCRRAPGCGLRPPDLRGGQTDGRHDPLPELLRTQIGPAC